MKTVLLILGAGVEACEGIQVAKSMGLSLTIVDANPSAPGFKFADDRIIASTYEPELIIEELKTRNIKLNGVIAMCADVPLSAAIISAEFGLVSLSLDSALKVADKVLMKKTLSEAGIPVPKFTEIFSVDELVKLEELIGLPLVIKPVDSRGARGVQLIEKAESLKSAYLEAKSESPSGRVMAESYVDGPQISTETLVVDQECYTLGFADRNYEWLTDTKPYFIENGGDSPSALNDESQVAVTALVEKAAQALGIKNGIAKGDMVLSEHGPMVIEIAGRLSGGYFSSTQIPLACGINFTEKAIKLALGRAISRDELIPTQDIAVAIRYLKAPAGVVKSIQGTREAEQSPGLKLLKLFISEGTEIYKTKNHTQRLGFVICVGDSKECAITRCEQALNSISLSYY